MHPLIHSLRLMLRREDGVQGVLHLRQLRSLPSLHRPELISRQHLCIYTKMHKLGYNYRSDHQIRVNNIFSRILVNNIELGQNSGRDRPTAAYLDLQLQELDIVDRLL
jgi:hypothetical protein